jgi:hypothetical protein
MKEQDMWKELIEVDKEGRMMWLPRIRTELNLEDYRSDPGCFVARCGGLRSLDFFDPRLSVENLNEVGNQEYITSESENVRVDGLLRLFKLFDYDAQRPEKVVLVGVLTPNSLLAVLSWLKGRDWGGCNVSVIDKNPVPVETICLMKNQGYIPWRGDLKIHLEDVLDWHPDQKQDLIIGDILNTWMVPHYFDPKEGQKPYADYSKYLNWARESLSDEGFFLSRCLVLPEVNKPGFAPDRKLGVEQKADLVIGRLGYLEEAVNKELLIQSLRRRMGYPPPKPRSDKVVPALKGKVAENKFIELYQKAFQSVDLITVRNQQSGYCHLNFLCRSS